MLAQVEDNLVFNGFAYVSARDGSPGRKQAGPQGPAAPGLSAETVAAVVTSWPNELTGLVRKPGDPPGYTSNAPVSTKEQQTRGQELIRAVSTAIGKLERRGHPGPFACILGNTRFDAAHTPNEDFMVLPADRIKPLLRGPLLRSGQIDGDAGIVVSLSGNTIDLVVATPPRAQFLQTTPDAKHVFRVYEKFTMRIKDPGAIEPLDLVVERNGHNSPPKKPRGRTAAPRGARKSAKRR